MVTDTLGPATDVVKPILLAQEQREAWFGAYAHAIAREKAVPSASYERIVVALQAAHSTIYRAVAFDVDGTLTRCGDTDIDPEMARIIGSLLRRGVPLLLITGRGRSSTRQAVREICDLARLHPSYLRRLRCITHNGLLYLETPNVLPTHPLSAEKPIAAPLTKAQDIKNALIETLRGNGLTFSITDEPSSATAGPSGLRIIFGEASIDVATAREFIIDAVRRVCGATEVPYLTRGMYGTTVSFDISMTNKKLTLAVFAEEIGVLVDQILRIGDQGDRDGNDYDLLDSLHGFSVGTFSEEPVHCHPIYDPRHDSRLEGAEATRALLSRVMLFPAISIAPEPAELRLKTFRSFERIALMRAREETITVVQRLRARLRYMLAPSARDAYTRSLELDDLFDRHSGAVRVRDSEVSDDLDKLPNLCHLFELGRLLTSRAEPKAARAMFSDTSILLRGPLYYFGITEPKRSRTLPRYLDLFRPFMLSAKAALREALERRLNLTEFKIILGIFDNVRNFLLVAMYSVFCLEQDEQESVEASLTAKLFGIACSHSNLHIDLIIDIDRGWRSVVNDYLLLLDELDLVFPTLRALAEGVTVVGQSDSIRRWRECDNFVQNYTACHLALNEFREQMAPEELERAVVLGLGYGGLEMPCLSTAVATRQGREIDAGMCDLSIYHDKTVGAQIRSGRYEDVRARLTAKRKVFVGDQAHTRWSSDWRSRSVILADDNCTTGVSLQLVH